MTTGPDELSALMRAANRGDGAAYRRLLERLAPWLRGVVRAGLRRFGQGDGDCEDIVQDTLLAVHLKRHSWDESQPIEPWLRGIARYRLVDALRRIGRVKAVSIDDLLETTELVAPQDAEGGLGVAELVGALPDRQRAVVVAVTIEGHSARDAGERLGMSEGHVRVTLHRALASLRSALSGDKRDHR